MNDNAKRNLGKLKQYFLKVRIIKNSQNLWVAIGRKNNWKPIYLNSLLKYLNCLDPLFERARDVSEFEFIFTLLRAQGLKSAGWDPWENTIYVFENIRSLLNKFKMFKKQTCLSLWLYGHIIEASEPYNITANLMRIIEGQRYTMDNFPDIVGKNNYSRPQSPSEKIRMLSEKAKKIGMLDSVTPLLEIYDRELRNAIFHSDYSIYGNEMRLAGVNLGVKSVYSHEELNILLNKTLAYFEAFKNLVSIYISSYQKPKVIPIHPDFSKDSEEKAVTVVRKGHGLAGLKDNWTLDQIKRGKIPFRTGRFLSYEIRMLDKDPTLTLLPPNRIKKINRILRLLPEFLRKEVIKFVEKQKWV